MTACTICPDRLLRPLLPLAFWLVVWQLAALAVGQSFILPGPAAVLGTLIQLAGVPSFWQTALLSLVRVLAGLLAGTLLGALTAALTLSLIHISFCIQFFHRKSEFSQDEFTEKTGSICSVIFQIEFPFPLSHKGLFNMLSLN